MSARNVPPINVLFLYMERKLRVTVWLAERTDVTLEGVISGFDEFMNVVLADVREVSPTGEKTHPSLMLKGDCIALIATNS